MIINTMTAMWDLLDAYTLTPEGKPRPVNQNNEWGGFSRRLNMPVFTGWFDLTKFDKANKTTSALVCDTSWTGRPVGLPNQERWLRYAETQNNGVAAFFIIHAIDPRANPRKVKYIDHEKVFVGPIVRNGGQAIVVGQPRRIKPSSPG